MRARTGTRTAEATNGLQRQHEFWRQRGVDLYDVGLEEFVADMERRLAEVTPA